jgi:predicted transposase YbfD/YdcC
VSIFEVLKNELNSIEDPRILGRTKHKLIDILIIGCLAVVCHAETWQEIVNFGNAKIDWLKKYLDLDNGIPSHDTFNRVFSLIAPKKLEIIFINWLNTCREDIDNDIIGIDGKTLKGTVKTKLGKSRDCLHVVNAWSTASETVIGQIKASGAGNCETTAAKELLDVLDISGKIVVCDAGVGRSSFIQKVLDKGAHYMTPIKGNPKVPYKKVDDIFSKIKEKNSASKRVETLTETVNKHGRKEKRYCTIIRKENFPKDLFFNKNMEKEYYPRVQVIGRIVYEIKEKETRPWIQENNGKNHRSKYKLPISEIREKKFVKYFITSLNSDIEEIFKAIRLQWSIENKLHWVLDTSFGEDANRTKNKVVAQNLALVRKIALNLAKQDKTKKMGMKTKLKLAGWDAQYLEQLLFKTQLA